MTEVPHNPVDMISTIDYKTAEDRGYFKLDFLNVSIYDKVKDEQHLKELMSKEPMWELLEHKDFSDKLFHVSGHEQVLNKTKPDSIEKLAAVLAMIRPAKRYLIGKPWQDILSEVWVKPTDGSYYFKKAHAMSYAVAVAVHMNLICEEVNAV